MAANDTEETLKFKKRVHALLSLIADDLPGDWAVSFGQDIDAGEEAIAIERMVGVLSSNDIPASEEFINEVLEIHKELDFYFGELEDIEIKKSNNK